MTPLSLRDDIIFWLLHIAAKTEDGITQHVMNAVASLVEPLAEDDSSRGLIERVIPAYERTRAVNDECATRTWDALSSLDRHIGTDVIIEATMSLRDIFDALCEAGGRTEETTELIRNILAPFAAVVAESLRKGRMVSRREIKRLRKQQERAASLAG